MDSKGILKSVRNNKRVRLKDIELAQDLWQRVKEFVPKQIDQFVPVGLNELFRWYKYEEGHRFKMHRDGSYQRNEIEFSVYTFLVYLNDDFEGGETIFKNGTVISPRQGDLLLFQHPLKHEGKEVLSGIKYALRTDVMYSS